MPRPTPRYLKCKSVKYEAFMRSIFHLYVATFQYHVHISLFLMDIPECRIWISLKEDAASKEAT